MRPASSGLDLMPRRGCNARNPHSDRRGRSRLRRRPRRDSRSRPSFFNLGAISLVMTDFLPARPEATSGNAPLFDIWRPIMVAIADTPATPTTPAAPGILTNLASVRGTLERARKIVEDAKANFITSLEAKAQLLGMMDEISGLSALSTTLTGQVAALSGLPGAIMGSVATLRPQPKSPPTRTGGPGVAPRQPHGQVLRDPAAAGRRIRRQPADGLRQRRGGRLWRRPGGNPLPQRRRRRPDPQPLRRGRTIGHRIDAWVWGYYRTQAELARSGGDIIFASSNTTPDPGSAAGSMSAGPTSRSASPSAESRDPPC